MEEDKDGALPAKVGGVRVCGAGEAKTWRVLAASGAAVLFGLASILALSPPVAAEKTRPHAYKSSPLDVEEELVSEPVDEYQKAPPRPRLPGSEGRKGDPHFDELEADPIHFLRELSRRRRADKPYARLLVPDPARGDAPADPQRSFAYPEERTIFVDTATGIRIWKMTHNPGMDRHRYSNIPVWSCDGSRLFFRSTRRDALGELLEGGWIMRADGSEIRYAGAFWGEWSRTDPDIFYAPDDETRTVLEVRLRPPGDPAGSPWMTTRSMLKVTGTRYLWIPPPSRDGRTLLAIEGHHAPGTRGDRGGAVGYLLATSGSLLRTIDFPWTTHQVWFTKEADDSFVVNPEPDIQTDKGTWRFDRDGRSRLLSPEHLSHQAWSPDGRRVAFFRKGLKVMNADGSGRVALNDDGGGHLSWEVTPDWLVSWQRERLRRVWVPSGVTDVVAAPNALSEYFDYYSEAHPESSPDGTKIAFASTLLGDVDLYVAVASLPGVPKSLRIAGIEEPGGAGGETHVGSRESKSAVEKNRGGADRSAGTKDRPDKERGAAEQGRTSVPETTSATDHVRLEWDPPARHAEIAGYRLYRRDAKGGPYALAERSLETSTTAEVAPPNQPRSGCWVVTAQDRSGLEGPPSQEVCLDTRLGGPYRGVRRLILEAEEGSLRGAVIRKIVYDASGQQAVSRSGAGAGRVSLHFDVPAARDYRLFARIVSRAAGSGVAARVDGRPAGRIVGPGPKWAWRAALQAKGPASLRLAAGEHAIDLALGPDLILDRVMLTTERSLPKGWTGFLDEVPPPVPTGLTAPRVGPNDVDLAWNPVDDPTFDHFSVYSRTGGEDVAATQRFLIRSPRSARMTDWGLQRGVRYVYRVTAVDRAGNESAPSEPMIVETPETPAETARVPAGDQIVGEELVEVPFSLAAPGDYRIWLRFSSKNSVKGTTLAATIDDEPELEWAPWFAIATRGHEGPVAGVEIWDLAGNRGGGGAAPQFHLAAGPHRLRVRAPGPGKVTLREIALTTDPGWFPPGRSSFLPPSDR